ncbi:MAG: hypothetical protein WCJ81_06765 [bacterium]
MKENFRLGLAFLILVSGGVLVAIFGDKSTPETKQHSVNPPDSICVGRVHGCTFTGTGYILKSGIYIPVSEERNVFKVLSDTSVKRAIDDSVRKYLQCLYRDEKGLKRVDMKIISLRGVTGMDSIRDVSDTLSLIGFHYDIETETW